MEEYKFNSCLMKKESSGRIRLNIENLDLLSIDEQEKIDNTNAEIISAKLDLEKNEKLILKNFDVLSKEKLSTLGIIKALNNRESFFYFLDYITHVNIIVDNNSKIIPIYIVKQKKQPEVYINLTDEKINVGKKIYMKKINCSENREISDEEKLIKKNINITNYFNMNESIKIKKLREKMIKYLNELTYMDKYKNNFPDFESELFYHYQLQNILESFEELKDSKFAKKINMIKDIRDFINKVKNNEIKDMLVLRYFYFIIDVEYKLKKNMKILISNYDENIKAYKDGYVIKGENKLIINDTNHVINNMDYFNLTDNIIQNIKQGMISLPLNKKYYSLKGYLYYKNSEKGKYNFYENFIQSYLFQDIMYKLYGLKNEHIFWKNMAELFNNNTYYFPIKNSDYPAYCDKKCFKIFIDKGIEKNKLMQIIDEEIVYIIKKGFYTLNNQHELGHGHYAIFFYLYPNSFNFDSPLAEIKLNSKNIIQTKEGGKIFEYLLFGKVINEMNLKEIIYITNDKNYSKSLEQYRKDFINLENENLFYVFDSASKENKEISEAFEAYKKLPNQIKIQLETEKFRSGKINQDMVIDFEKYKFSSVKERKCPIEERRKIYEN